MTRRPARFARRCLALGLVLLMPGCSTWKPLRQPVADAVAAPDPVEHVRVHLRNGARLELEIREVTADSLRGWAYGTPSPKLDRPSAKHGHPVAIALSDIAKIESRRKDALTTSLLVLGIAGTVAAAALLVLLATMDPIFTYQN